MKKLFILLLAFVMLMSMVACGKTETTETPETTDKTTTETTTTEETENLEVNEYGWAIPTETFEFSYYKKKQENPDQIAQWLELMNTYLLDEFNLVINRLVYDTDADERLNLMLTSGDYPEVITGLDRTDVLRLLDLGIVVDVAPYIETSGQNITKELGDLYPRYLEEDGSLYGLPYGWGILNIPDYSAFVRWDWYQEMGSPEFETPEEYYQVIKDMIELHPEARDGSKVYAMSWNDRSYIETIAGAWGLKEGYKEEGNTLTHWINTPEGYEFTKFMNTIHQDGLLDPDAFTNDFSEYKSKLSSGKILGGIGPWYQCWSGGHEIWQATDENWTEDQRFVQYPIKAESADVAYLSPKDTTGWGYTVITDKAEDPEMIVKVFDFMMTPMGSRLFAWGVPNTPESNWTFDNGDWDFTELAKDGVINATLDYNANKMLGTNYIWLVHPQGEFSDDKSTNAWIDQCFNTEAKWKKVLNENMAGTMYDNSAMRAIVYEVEADVTLYKQQVEDATDLYWTIAVLSNSDEEFEENYQKLKDALKQAGVDELQAYISEEYFKIKEAWGQ